MSKGGSERMAEAMNQLEQVVKLIDEGKAGAKVLMPIKLAVLALRIPEKNLLAMGERDQELGISAVDSSVCVKLLAGEGLRRYAYEFLYGLIQSVGMERREFPLFAIPKILLDEIPALEGVLEGIKAGMDGDIDQDLQVLHVHLWANWLSLKDRAGLEHPKHVFEFTGLG